MNAVAAKPLTSWRPHWAKRFGTAPFLPMSRAEMQALGWDQCDIILVTGDAYIDHPSFGMALVGRLLEAQGFRVGIISQPDWHSAEAFRALGAPALFFGITAGNMDSMVNRYTADRKIRSDDAYTPNAEPNKRPDRAVVVYAQRAREAFPEANVVIGSIEASLRRIAHYDYWSDTVRRSVLPDSKADLLLFGNAERALVELSHRLARSEKIESIRDLRGTAFMAPRGWRPTPDWVEADSTTLDTPGAVHAHPDPYAMEEKLMKVGAGDTATVRVLSRAERLAATQGHPRAHRRAPAVLRAGEGRPGALRPCLPRLPPRIQSRQRTRAGAGARQPRRLAESAANPAEHGRDGPRLWPALRARAASVLRHGEDPGLGNDPLLGQHHARLLRRLHLLLDHRARGPHHPEPLGSLDPARDRGNPRQDAGLHRRGFRPRRADRQHVPPGLQGQEDRENCRRLSCVYPGICENLGTDHAPLVSLYRKARALPGIKKILIGSGLRYDLAVRSPEYVRELVSHHVGGYLKIAPEHSQEGPLSKMMKPGMASYERFKQMFERFSKEAGKEQYLIPYFIAGHPGTTDEDMLELALWLKRNGFRLDQVQTFLPTPLALATAMWHTEKNPLRKVAPQSEKVAVVRSGRQRKLQKAFLRYHDPENWPLLREALTSMGRADLIGPGKRHLVPARQPAGATAQGDGRPPLRGQKSAPATRRPAPSPAKPGRHGTLAGRHPGVPKHPLSRRKGG